MEEQYLKRLLYYLNQITDSNTTTYRYNIKENGVTVQKELYDGECNAVHLKPGGEAAEHVGVRREPAYWQNGISYFFERTNRLALDRPTVTVCIPCHKLNIDQFTTAGADFCLREINTYFNYANKLYENKARPDSDNGKFYVYSPSSEVLVRNASYFSLCPQKDYENGRGATIYDRPFNEPLPDIMCLCIRLEIQLPHGKLKRMRKMLTKDLPDCTEKFIREFSKEKFIQALELEKTQNSIREYLKNSPYCAFIANGSILAREKGSTLPMKDSLPFISAKEDEIEIDGIRGLGIKRGVTVITGGGYSGKSTVLNAISSGIYNHVKGDGRELCIADESAVTITAEDGRVVSCLNISPFIKWIPNGSPNNFSTAHASGSTSQAANIIEAIDCGSKLLLIDEDRSATNFMIRDSLMKELIKKEPITPFTDRVRELTDNNISTILVIGGSSEYLSVADKIYLMDDFIINDVSVEAKRLVKQSDTASQKAKWKTERVMFSEKFTSYPDGNSSERLAVSDTGFIIIGDEKIDIRALHDISTPAQADTLAFMLRFLVNNTDKKDELEMLALSMRGLSYKSSVNQIDTKAMVNELYENIKKEGLNLVNTGFFTSMNRFLDLPRSIELHAAINRMRHTVWKSTAR